MWWIRMLVLAVVLIVILGFALQNLYQEVEINIWKWHWTEVPLILVIFESFVAGVLVWFLITIFHDFQLKAELRGERRRAKHLQEELTALRNLPLDESEERAPHRSGGEEE